MRRPTSAAARPEPASVTTRLSALQAISAISAISAIGVSGLILPITGLSGCQADGRSTRAGRTVAALPAPVMRGFCYAHTYEDRGQHGYGTASSQDSKTALRALGTDWLSLTPFAFVPTRSSPEVLLIAELMQRRRAQAAFEQNQMQAETDEVVRAEIAQAKAMGFKVQLKPHLWMLDGSWRGQIDLGTPSAWAEFWTNYRRYILHYADLASDTGVEMLVIGVELDQTVDSHAEQWRRLIRDVRSRFKGTITYASNWDAYDRVPFWPSLDYIGVQFYPPLADSADADFDAMSRRLDAAFAPLGELARRLDKRVLLTEVGYRAVKGTAIRPHEWPDPNARVVDAGAQADAYRVFLGRLAQQPFISGVFLWKWYTDEAGDEGPAGFSVRGKPAAALIRQAFARE